MVAARRRRAPRELVRKAARRTTSWRRRVAAYVFGGIVVVVLAGMAVYALTLWRTADILDGAECRSMPGSERPRRSSS